ncbi:hypothetical protein Aperf_G00000072407 [Anoplocephala perfoliata]
MPADEKVVLSSVESSILEYVLNLHCSQTVCKRSAYLALLCHARLLARGARLVDNDKHRAISVLPDNWAASDPIRMTYKYHSDSKESLASSGQGSSDQLLQLSITETDDHVFINMTNSTTDKFGHLELTGPAHVRLDSAKPNFAVNPSEIFSQLEGTLYEMDENLLKVVLPKPMDKSTSLPSSSQAPRTGPFLAPGSRPVAGVDPNLGDYGRSDLDPIGTEPWTRPFGGSGGMVIDPTQALRRPPFGLSSPGGGIGGMVPPGARFDPIGPPMMPTRGIGPRGSRFNNPDPDSALPPGWEDMYM